MVPLDCSCFTKYITDVFSILIIKGINGDTTIHGIDNLKLILSERELTLYDVLHAPGLLHCILALDVLMIDDVEIMFRKPYCILEKDRFYIKSKFTASLNYSNKLF